MSNEKVNEVMSAFAALKRRYNGDHSLALRAWAANRAAKATPDNAETRLNAMSPYQQECVRALRNGVGKPIALSDAIGRYEAAQAAVLARAERERVVALSAARATAPIDDPELAAEEEFRL